MAIRFPTVQFRLPTAVMSEFAAAVRLSHKEDGGVERDTLPWVPGAKIWADPRTKDESIIAPVNAAPIIRKKLQQHQVHFREVEWRATTPKLNMSSVKMGSAIPHLSPELRQQKIDGIYPFQAEGLRWSVPRLGSLLLWPPGSGKTPAGIIHGLAAPGTVVYITRGSVRLQIAAQVQSWSTVDPVVLDGDFSGRWFTKEQVKIREKLNDGAVRFIIVGWEILPAWMWLLKELPRGTVNTVIYDETHRGSSAKRARRLPMPDGTYAYIGLENIVDAAATLSKMHTVERRLGTTGTLVRDRPRNVWGPMDLIEPYQWGSSYEWAFAYCAGRKGDWGGVWDKGRSREDELAERLKHSVHEISTEVARAHLPPMRREVIHIPFEMQDAKPAGSDELQQEYRKSKGNASALFEWQLKRVASRKRSFVVDFFMERLRAHMKCVIFTGRVKDVDVLREAFEKALAKDEDIRVRQTWLRTAHGGDSDKYRFDTVQEYFKLEGPALLIATGQSMGESVDGLQDTDAAGIVYLPWSPDGVYQMEGRFPRTGQRRPCTVYYFIARGTAEMKIASVLIEKLPAVGALTKEKSSFEIADQIEGIKGNEGKILQEFAEFLAKDPVAALEEFG